MEGHGAQAGESGNERLQIIGERQTAANHRREADGPLPSRRLGRRARRPGFNSLRTVVPLRPDGIAAPTGPPAFHGVRAARGPEPGGRGSRRRNPAAERSPAACRGRFGARPAPEWSGPRIGHLAGRCCGRCRGRCRGRDFGLAAGAARPGFLGGWGDSAWPVGLLSFPLPPSLLPLSQ